MRITVIGCGRWGSFISKYLCDIGHDVTLYGRPDSLNMALLITERRNSLLSLPQSVTLDTTCSSFDAAQIIVISVPSQKLDSLMRELQARGVHKKTYVLCMKGIDCESLLTLSGVAERYIDAGSSIAVWLGPGHVEDFCRGTPNCMVIDSRDEQTKKLLVEQFSSKLIRFYYGSDLIGNEVGAASKNVIGIAAGMLDGLGLTSIKGALMSRGTREIARLITAMGGDERSAYGLCHLGDYEATVFSPHSHNRRFGEAFVRGEEYSALAEGYYTALALHKLGEKHKVELPICEAVYSILYENNPPAEALETLFTRTQKTEF